MNEELGKYSCAVCAHKLNHLRMDDGSERWVHGGLGDDTHPPIPVRETEVKTIYACDFCSRIPTEFVLPVRSFMHLGRETKEVTSSVGDWAVCWTCGALVLANDWRKLMLRMVKAWNAKYGEPMSQTTRWEMWDFLQTVQDNIYGPLREM